MKTKKKNKFDILECLFALRADFTPDEIINGLCDLAECESSEPDLGIHHRTLMDFLHHELECLQGRMYRLDAALCGECELPENDNV